MSVPDLSVLSAQANQLQASVNRWNDAVIWLTVIIAILGVFAGAARYYQSRDAKRLAVVQANISKEKDAQLARDLKDKDIQIQAAKQKLAETDLEIAEANRRQAEAALSLERLRTNVGWRHIVVSKFLAALQGQPKPTSVAIIYLKDDNEAWNLAREIFTALNEAKWPVSFPEPIQTNQARIFYDMPTIAGAGGNAFGGITLVSSIPFTPLLSQNQNAFGALVRAFMAGSGGGIAASQPIPDIGIVLPDDSIRIVVGPRMDSAYPWHK